MRALFFLAILITTTFAQEQPAEPRIAPKGLVYLVKRISSFSDSGVVSFDAGREARVIEDRGEKLLVEIGTDKIEIYETDATNDLDVRDALKSQVTQEKAQILQAKAEQSDAMQAARAAQAAQIEQARQAADLAKLQASIVAAEKEMGELKTARQNSIRKGNDDFSPENTQRKARYDALKASIAQMKATIKVLAAN
jgi:hypothetical protein